MISKILLSLFFSLIVLSPVKISAQSFGFGCLGFVGGYAGFSYQVYSPKGLNEYIGIFNSVQQDSFLISPMTEFGKAKGYRVGLNLFRANLEGLILTAKGFYQFLGEKHEASQQLPAGSKTTTYELELKNWGVGLDLGTTITKALSWKVIDAALLFYTANFTNTQNLPGISEVKEYQTEASKLGYTIGTGFILAVIDEYITIEGVAAYTVFSIDKMKLSETEYLTVNEYSNEIMQNFIEAGGFNAVIQLNIGFPL
jgi:hypothetical protein